MIEKKTSYRLSRRRFITMASLSAASLVTYSINKKTFAAQLSAVESPISTNEFLSLSELLTGRQHLDLGIAKRALNALVAVDKQFAAKAKKLNQAIVDAKFVDMTQFDSQFSHDPQLKQIAISIISAWYLGYTGTPEGESNHDNAQYVSYQDALMYQPTLDATIVPTFSRGHTNYWVEPPRFN